MNFFLNFFRNLLPFIFLSLLFLLAVTYNYYQLWLLVLGIATVLMISGLCLCLLPLGKMEILWEERKNENNELELTFSAKVPSFFLWGSGWLYFKIATEEFEYKISGKRRDWYLVSLEKVPRGEYQLTELYVEAKDFLGVFHKSRKLTTKQKIEVLPKEVPALWEEIQRMLETLPKWLGSIKEEPSYELKKIRDYATGDTPQQIHWKLSGKRQVLTVKEYEKEQDTKELFLFLGSENFAFEDSLQLFYTGRQQIRKVPFDLVGKFDGEAKYIEQPIREDFCKIQPLKSHELPKVLEELGNLRGYQLFIFGMKVEDLRQFSLLETLFSVNQGIFIWKEEARWQLFREADGYQISDCLKEEGE